MAIDRHVAGRVGEHQISALIPEQPRIAIGSPRITTDQLQLQLQGTAYTVGCGS
jgi:hypothetical protein